MVSRVARKLIQMPTIIKNKKSIKMKVFRFPLIKSFIDCLLLLTLVLYRVSRVTHKLV